jgi:hypothetical protein
VSFAEGTEMQAISDRLDDKVQEIIDSPGFRAEKADFQPHAKSLWLAAEAAGYSVAELKEACGGDIERYLLDQQKVMTDVETQSQIVDGSVAQ